MRQNSAIVVVVWLILNVEASLFGANTLYTLNVTGELLTVNTETGFTTPIFTALGAGSWSGLSASPIESNVLFAINNPRPLTLADPQFSRLARINLDDGAVALFPFFDTKILGSPNVFSSGIAISPSEPNVAIVTGSDSGFPPQPYLYRVDTATGEVLESAKPLVNIGRVESLTFGSDGTTLYGANQDGELVKFDPQSAEASFAGDPQLTNFLTGLAFEPDEGELFAIDGLGNDRLVRLDPLTGAVVETIGPLGIKGPEGLAFVSEMINTLDCTGDGGASVADLACSNAHDTTQQLLAALNLLAGDLDGQNGVAFADFLILSTNFGQPVSRYIDGDINDNSKVDFADFLILSANFGRSPTALLSTVPEPSGLTIAAITIAAGLAYFRSWCSSI